MLVCHKAEISALSLTDSCSCAVERTQSYEILGILLRNKAAMIDGDTHEAILSFCGFDLADPTKSVASNVLAFRFLVLDFALWTTADHAIQFAHLHYLRTLIQNSEHTGFNARRLTKMRKCLGEINLDANLDAQGSS